MSEERFPGEALRERREDLGLSTAEVFRKTRIPMGYIDSLERGAQVSLHKDGLTPLLVAEGNGFDDIAALLREHGARPVE